MRARLAAPLSRANVYTMPAPGPKDGHASKASRDLGGIRGLTREIKNVAVKSNGFKGASNARARAGVRLGMGNGAKAVAAREALRAKLLARRLARANGEVDAPTARTSGSKRKAGDAEKADEEEAAKTQPPEETIGRVNDSIANDDEEAGRDTEEVKRDAEEALAASGYACDVCGIKCGTMNNYRCHANSKKHRLAAQRAKGREILAGLKAKRAKTE